MSTEQSSAIARAGRGVNPPKGNSATGIQRSQLLTELAVPFPRENRLNNVQLKWRGFEVRHQTPDGQVGFTGLISCDLPDCEHLATYCVRASDRLHPNPDTQQKYMWPDASFLKSAYSDNYTATTHAMYTWPETYTFCVNIRIIYIYTYLERYPQVR